MAASPAAADPTPTGPQDLGVAATGGETLAGAPREVSFTVTNPDGVTEYNSVTVATLPVGVTYVPGSASASLLGEPTISTWIPDPNNPSSENPATAQVLVWSNVADHAVNSSFDASFEVVGDATLYPAGSSFDVDVAVYSNSDERTVPQVTIPPSGPPTVTDFTASGASAATVTVVPITISKAETANAENEVYRGPKNPATFELTVTTAKAAGTTGVVVVDYVPAQFTVTSCDPADECTSEIVKKDGSVFTKLTWTLGDLPADKTVVLTYKAYVDELTITMPDGDPTGDDTRPGPDGYTVKNTATLTGTYEGDVATGTSKDVNISDDETVRILDLGLVKTTDPGTFEAGKTRQYTLKVRTSQYITSSDITVTDIIPDGFCPVPPKGMDLTGWPADCKLAAAGGGTVTGATMSSVDFDASTGQFTVVFTVADLDSDEDATIGYTAYMRKHYQSGTPTAAGDTFTNTASVSGTTNNPATGDVDSTNDSSANVTTASADLVKRIWANAGRTLITGVTGAGNTCANGKPYTQGTQPAYRLDDLVCFRLASNFPTGVSTRSAVLTDFLPVGMALVGWAATGSNDTTITLASPDDNTVQWLLGDMQDGVRYVAPGAKLEVDVLARVTSVPQTMPQVTANLAKMRYATADGLVVNLRDEEALKLAPAPVLAIDKLVDGQDSLNSVVEGQDLKYTIAVTHKGTETDLSNAPIHTMDVWDVLPAGFSCGNLSSVTPKAKSCDLQTDGTTRVTWELTFDPLFRTGDTTTLSYTLKVPTPTSVSTAHTNTAAVTRYTIDSTDGIDQSESTFYPTNPVGAFPEATKNAPQVADTATIDIAAVTASKAVLGTSVTEQGNNAASQATIGEQVTWTYSATMPGHTSIFNGTLRDGLPVGATLDVEGQPAPTMTSTAAVPSAVGCTRNGAEFRLCTDPASTEYGTLFFPTTWTNRSDQPVTFTVTLPTRVADVAANTHGASITNTAVLTSTPTAEPTGEEKRADATASVSVVVPEAKLSKGASLTGTNGPWTMDDSLIANGGQRIYYQLNATNDANRPPLHDATIVDCIDNRLSDFRNYTRARVATVSTGSAGNGSNGCPTGTVKYTWTLTGPLSGTASLVYSAVAPNPVPAGSIFTNNAELTGSTLKGIVAGERTLKATAKRSVTAASPMLTKTRTTPAGSAVPGEEVTWRLAVDFPVGVNLYNARIIDTLGKALGTASDATYTLTCPDDGNWAAGTCPTGERLTSADQRLGIYLGNIPAAPQVRKLFIDVHTLILTSTDPSVLQETNSAVISWNATDSGKPDGPVLGTNTSPIAKATVDIRHPLVTVTKTVSSTQPAQGEIFTYTVTGGAVQNATPNGKTAYNVTIVDAVPTGVIPVKSATDATLLPDGAVIDGGGIWNGTARTFTWNVDSLDAGKTVTFTYPAKLDLAANLTGQPLTNTVTPQSWDSLATGGKTYGPGSPATAKVTPAYPVIDATKTLDTSNPVYIGQQVPFSLTLTNNGTATATSMSAVDTLPVGWSYVTGSATLGGAPLGDPVITGQKLKWSGLGALAPGASHTIAYKSVAADTVDVGSNVAHTNEVTAAGVTDATGGTSMNNGQISYIGHDGSATARIDQADVQIVKTADTFTAGGQGDFTLTVTNNGQDPAVGVTVDDELTLPAGVTFSSVSPEGGTCTVAGAKITCTLGSTLAVGATWVIKVSLNVAADVASGTTIPNTATVSAKTADDNPDNNTSTAKATVLTSADVKIVKEVTTPSSGPVTAGEDMEWKLTVTNLGPSISRAPIQVTDTIPSGVTGVKLIGVESKSNCTLTGNKLDCQLDNDLAVGGTFTVTLRGTVSPSVEAGADVISNTAVVTPTTDDPVKENNTSTATTDVVTSESLTVDKSIIDPAPPADVVPGTEITYTLDVHNAGPSDARGVYIDDVLPAGLTFVTMTKGTDWTYQVNGSTVRFSYGKPLAAGASAPQITYTALLDADFTGQASDLTNTATVSSDWKKDQDEDSATPGTPAPSADLAIEKTVSPTSGNAAVIAGETAVYTFEVTNYGPSDAEQVMVVDTLPAGLTIEGDLPDGCTASGRTITCVLDTSLVADGSSWNLSFKVRVDSSFKGSSIDNVARVRSVTPDPDRKNNIDKASLDVIQRAKLKVTKTASPDTVTAGEAVTWNIDVSNEGPSAARDVVLTDTLNKDLEFVSATSTTPGVTCTGAANLTCLIGTIPAGGKVTITLKTTVRSSVADGSTIPNAATADSTTIDPDTDKPATATGKDTVTVEALSTLTVEKKALRDTVAAGSIVRFQINVTNKGPSDAAAPVTMTDTLPTGMTFLRATTVGGPDSWSCTAAGQKLTCVLVDGGGTPVPLAATAQAPTLEVLAQVLASQAPGKLTNTVEVTSGSTPKPATDDATVLVTTAADLGIRKRSTGTPTAGLPFTWDITVMNHGPSDSVASPSEPIVVTDVLPAGVEFVSATGTTCSAEKVGGRDKVTCLITTTLKPGDSVTMHLVTDIAEGVTGGLTNTATVTPVTPEPEHPVYPNESTDVTPPVVTEADLAIEKAVTTPAADIVAGGAIAWKVTVTNLGPSTSKADANHPILVTDTLPAGVKAVAASGPSKDWKCSVADDKASVTCALSADLQVNDPQVITVEAMIDPGVQGSVTNTATVAPGLTAQPDGATDNDTAAATSTVDESADLRLVKDVSSRIVAGSTGRYLLQVFNDGPSTARDVVITDTLPEGLTYAGIVTDEGVASPWTCTASSDGRTVVCTYADQLGPGTVPVLLELEVNAAPGLSGLVRNVATVDSTTPDPVPGNNTDDAEGLLVTSADLALDKSHTGQPVAGTDFDWTITVTNNGPSDSVASKDHPIVVTDTLPAGTTFVSDGSSKECSVAGDDPQTVTCLVTATIAAGGKVELTVRVAIDAAATGDLANTATVTPGATGDPDQANNTDTDQVTVKDLADLSVVKSATSDSVVAGGELSWKIQVSNLGPSVSHATADQPIRITDTLPAGVSFVSATGEGWVCSAGEPVDGRDTVECLRSVPLAVGDAPVITVTGSVAADVQGSVRNHVTVAPGTTPEPPDSTDNDHDDATTPVTESADLVLTKVVSQTITAGANGQYTLTVTNLGPSTARDISIVDTLPAGLTFESAAGAGWTCAPSAKDTQKVLCTFDGVLAPGDTLTLTIKVSADQGLQHDVVNTATVDASTPDPDEDNNTDTATGTVAQAVDLAIVKTAVGSPVVGGTFDYQLQVTNAGPSTARGVLVEDRVPASLEVLKAGGDGWTCAVNDAVTCYLPELRAGAKASVITVTVRVLPAAYPGVSNTATVASTTPEEPDTMGDNTSTATVTVPPLSELTITKDLIDTLVTGQDARYTIKVTNIGPTEDPGPITITDPMPDGLVAHSATLEGADGSCTVTSEEATCIIDSLAVGQTVTMHLTVYVSADASGEIVNVATVTEFDGVTTEDDAVGVVSPAGLPNAGGGLGLSFSAGILLLVGAVSLIGTRVSRGRK